MKGFENYNKYLKFRKEHPVFEFSESNITKKEGGILLNFVFKVGEDFEFRPALFFPIDDKSMEIADDFLQTLAFNIGMVEMISYWKAFCSPKIIIKPFRLKPDQENWWKKLFRHGLGEFFYINGIKIPGDEMVRFSYAENATFHGIFKAETSQNEFLIPLGGGKDSVVTLALLQQNEICHKILVINHRGATRDVVAASGTDSKNVIEVLREIDPLLIKLNQQGFLNGHTPFSALLAFVSATVSALTGVGSIALSNESSANEPTIPGTIINHQYSKSLEFELDFREYLNEFVATGINYFSLMRPLNELQIGALFSRFEKYHGVFKSCNIGSKTDSWCCNCSKCLFTYIILSPFLNTKKLKIIFGQNLFEKIELAGILDELSGISNIKPFECVGTVEEVNAALIEVISNHSTGELPALLKHYQENRNKDLTYRQFEDLLTEFQQPNFVEPRLVEILKKALMAERKVGD